MARDSHYSILVYILPGFVCFALIYKSEMIQFSLLKLTISMSNIILVKSMYSMLFISSKIHSNFRHVKMVGQGEHPSWKLMAY